MRLKSVWGYPPRRVREPGRKKNPPPLEFPLQLGPNMAPEIDNFVDFGILFQYIFALLFRSSILLIFCGLGIDVYIIFDDFMMNFQHCFSIGRFHENHVFSLVLQWFSLFQLFVFSFIFSEFSCFSRFEIYIISLLIFGSILGGSGVHFGSFWESKGRKIT